MYSPYILRYRYCRHVTLDVFWLKVKKAFRNVDTLFSISLSLSLFSACGKSHSFAPTLNHYGLSRSAELKSRSQEGRSVQHGATIGTAEERTFFQRPL